MPIRSSFYCTTMYCLFMLKQHCHWLTDQFIERDQGVTPCFQLAEGVDKTAFWKRFKTALCPQRQSERADQQTINCISLYLFSKCHFKPFNTFWKSFTSGWGLICTLILDINAVGNTWTLKAEVKHSLRWLQTGLQRKRAHMLCHLSVL